MSPLIDVTNTPAPDIPKEIQVSFNKNSLFNESEPKNMKSSLLSAHNDLSGFDVTKDITSLTKCNNTKVSYLKRKKEISRIPTIKSDENKSSGLHLIDRLDSSQRVPPLPTEDLFQAFSLLHIGKQNFKTSNLSKKDGCSLSIDDKNLEICKHKLTGSSNDVGLPSNSFTSTYQCVACSLEFSLLENLTCHLVKHIYEGLHAASWLSNAMSILVPQPLDIPCNVVHSVGEEQQNHIHMPECTTQSKLDLNNKPECNGNNT